jgi:uncharacterized protein
MPPSLAAAIAPMPGGVRLSVRAQPRASRQAIVGVVDDGRGGAALKIAITAPPVDGAANEAIARLVAEALGVPAAAVKVARGGTGRNKLVEVRGVGYEDALRRLAAQC